MSLEIENVVARRRSGANTAAAEVWIAYLHLMKAKEAMRDQGMINEIQGLMEAALDAFRRYQSNPPHGTGRWRPPS